MYRRLAHTWIVGLYISVWLDYLAVQGGTGALGVVYS